MENSTSSRPGCPVIQFFSSLNERLGGGGKRAVGTDTESSCSVFVVAARLYAVERWATCIAIELVIVVLRNCTDGCILPTR